MPFANNIELDQIIAAISNAIKADENIVALLALSSPVNNPDAEKARANSIVPMSKISEETGTRPVPLIGIRSGNMTRVGYNSYDVFIFIRCYTSLDKAFVVNNKIVSLVNRLLDRQFITVPTAAIAEMTLEQVSGEEYDEWYKLNYRECQFRLNIT